jgi:hypothetical protein
VLATASLRLDLYLQLRTVPALSQSGLRPRLEAARVSVRVQIFSSSECSLGPTAPTESPFSCFDSGRMDPNPTPSSSGRAQAYCAPAAQPARLTTIAPRCSYEINYRWELRVRNRSKQPCEKWTLTTQWPQAAITALGLAILPLIQLTPAVSASSLNSGHRSVGTLTAKLRIRLRHGRSRTTHHAQPHCHPRSPASRTISKPALRSAVAGDPAPRARPICLNVCLSKSAASQRLPAKSPSTCERQ